ncbi:unnamed protein product [Trichogramma brassicae]|uniref:Reverse transcriptase domain-containing protein n=1 Tax=Trichogramma brassicae TaxID=86971 RepID=A0A6H5J4U0_9HYME|nr:unnamed protein product [Trichogramma brassicae]
MRQRMRNFILQQDNARPHTARITRACWENNRIISGTYDIVSVAETFLESSDNTSPFHIAGYNFLHCHRRGKEGGGIGLYVREDLAVEKLVAMVSIYNYTPEYQIISIKNSNNMKLLFTTVYPWNPEAGYPEEFFEVFYRLLPLYDNVIVTGDFNIHVNRPNDRLIKQLEPLSLHLVSTMPTNHVIYHDESIHENCLDLVMVHDTSLIESSSRSSSPFAAAHDFIDFEYRLSHDIAPAVTKFTRDFRRVTTETFAPMVEINIGFSRDGLSLFEVDETAVGGRVVTGALLDLAVAMLSSALIEADLVAPLSAPRPASRRNPWVTSQIRDLIRERDRVHRLFRRGRSSFTAYKELRSRVRNLLDTAKNQHLASRVAGAADVQSRWRTLRSMGVSSPRLPSPLASFSADELCSHYVAVGSRHQHGYRCCPGRAACSIRFSACDEGREDGMHTESRAVPSGVPQGSVLAPLLFSVFIADLSTCHLTSRHIIYADDTQIISHGLPANIGDLLRDVTRDPNAVCEWATTNGLTCNAAKTKVILIGSLSFVTSLRPTLPAGLNIGGEIVPFSEEIKTLGVFLSGKFNWNRQIAFMTTKVHHSLYALRFYKHALSRKIRLMLVGALVAPHPFQSLGDLLSWIMVCTTARAAYLIEGINQNIDFSVLDQR